MLPAIVPGSICWTELSTLLCSPAGQVWGRAHFHRGFLSLPSTQCLLQPSRDRALSRNLFWRVKAAPDEGWPELNTVLGESLKLPGRARILTLPTHIPPCHNLPPCNKYLPVLTPSPYGKLIKRGRNPRLISISPAPRPVHLNMYNRLLRARHFYRHWILTHKQDWQNICSPGIYILKGMGNDWRRAVFVT